MVSDLLRIESKVDNNTSDIRDLTNQVIKIATIVEASEKRHTEDLTTVRSAMDSINRLNDKMATALNLEKDVSTLKETISELKSETRVLRHDMNTLSTVSSAQTAILAATQETKAKVESLEQWRDRANGGATVIKYGTIIFWSIFGTGALAIGAYMLQSYFNM